MNWNSFLASFCPPHHPKIEILEDLFEVHHGARIQTRNGLILKCSGRAGISRTAHGRAGTEKSYQDLTACVRRSLPPSMAVI